VKRPLVAAASLLVCLSLAILSSARGQPHGPKQVGPPPLLARPGSEPAQISQYVREVFQDREGNYWFGTNGDGVCRYDGTSLVYFSHDQGFGGVAVRGILQDGQGAVWFATDGGVSRYQAGKFTNYTTANGLSANSVWCIMLDKRGAIWAGTHEGVCRFDGEFFIPFALPRVEVENPESRFTPKVVFAMFEDRAGNLWFGTDGEGAHRFDGKSFTSFTTREGLAGNMVRAIAGDRLGRIWIGSDGGGVSCYDGVSFRNFTAADGLNNDRVYEIREDRAGNMWFSTLGAGACRYDGVTFTPFGAEQGLSTDELPCPCGSGWRHKDCHGPVGAHVQEFFEDRDGVLWFGCSGGLFRLDGERVVNVTKEGPWPKRAEVPGE
jgi:ligand-binding sensor domain-containing protein